MDDSTIFTKKMETFETDSSYFRRNHIEGDHPSCKKRNTKARFDQVQYKSVALIENYEGSKDGQTKFVTKIPIHYEETGREYRGENGNKRFLVTGQKNGKKVIPEHLDGPIVKSEKKKIMIHELKNGQRIAEMPSSDTAEFTQSDKDR